MLAFKSSFNRLLRSATSGPALQVRGLKDSKGKPRKYLTLHDVDIVHNPSEKLIDEFMKGYGKKRLEFKKSDFDMWKKSFGYDYDLVFLCLKNTDKIIQTYHVINYNPIFPEKDVTHQHHGMVWADEDYRGKDTLILMDYCFKSSLRNFSDGITGHYYMSSKNLLMKVYGTNQYEHLMYVSYYKPEELRIPDELKFDGISVKSAMEVPDDDITEYDQGIFPYKRANYMLANLRDPDGVGKVAYDENGKVVGFGVLIRYPSGECMLNPLYADSPKIAQAIFKSILKEFKMDEKTRFHIKSIGENSHLYNWIQPFLKCPPRREFLAHTFYSHTPAVVDWTRAYAPMAVTTSYV